MNEEQKFINSLIKGYKRSANQINRVHESDSELIRLSSSGQTLAITTDTLVEEITHSLYDDSYLIGWMSVVSSASDLAAVGAEPLGILISATFTEDRKNIQEIQLGIKDACNKCNIPLLGGDTNFSEQLSLTGTAVGVVQEGRQLTRLGARPGDVLACSAPLGAGGLYAYQKLLSNKPHESIAFRPLARLREGKILSSYASSCIDTSDGLFCCLEDLMGVSGYGFKIDTQYHDILETKVLNSNIPVPRWAFLAAHHGEYELVFTVEPSSWEKLLDEGEKIGWTPVKLGEVVETPGIHLKEFTLPQGIIHKTWSDSNGDVKQYFNKLLQLGES